MKKTAILLLAALAFVGIVNAQEANENWGMIKNQQKRSDKLLTNPKQTAKPTFWIKRAQTFKKLHTFFPSKLQEGGLINAYQQDEPYPLKKENEGGFVVYTYKGVKIYTENNIIKKYIETDTTTDPLITAYEALLKAIELDTDGKKTAVIKQELETLASPILVNKAISYINGDDKTDEDYKNAGKYFEYYLAANENKFVNKTDTAKYFLCGNVYKYIKDTAKAIEYYEKAMNKGYEKNLYPDLYYLTKDADPDKAISYLLTAMKIDPSQTKGYVDAIGKLGKIDLAIQEVQKQIDADPKNASAYGIIAEAYNNKGDYEKAAEYAKKGIELAPENASVNYTGAIVYFNIAVKLFEKANDVKTNAESQKVRKQANDNLKAAEPLFKKAAEKSEDKSIKYESYNALSQIYVRLNMMDKSKEAKEKRDNL